MTMKLFMQAITKFLLGIILVGMLIFLPAGTFSYFNGWFYDSRIWSTIWVVYVAG